MVNSFIPLCIPEMTGREKTLVSECFDTNWVSYAGSFVGEFERLIAEASGCSHAVAVTSGTAALHLGLVMAGVQAGDEVVMPGISFVAPANAVRYVGAWPCFLDVDSRDWQLSPSRVREFLTSCRRGPDGRLYNSATKRPVTCLMPVHLLGGLADSRALGAICDEFGLPMVEDAAECLGASFLDRNLAAPLGTMEESRRFLGTSFNGNKIITTGGGGAVICNDPASAERVKHLSTTAKTDPATFFHDELGFNYRLTNTAAAMGVAQIETLGERVIRKREIARRYGEAFDDLDGVRLHPEPKNCESTFWLYTLQLDCPSAPLIARLEEARIQARPIWHPLSNLPYLRKDCWNDGMAFGSSLVKRAISIPCSHGLSKEDQERVVQVVREYFQSR
ncbi:DegT/DnrJ/EryC1/StrS family aminotransferase [Akkermansiaceae bacterium]|nr:DegT/DnrJ/EryC1/StrS family aminotransferase [Akkermansiaceae bacterium]MDB4538160.1 DegT/DnrJ/EryC1/StrS family aminotransferase [Akkermansiaceae bacterium]MDB4544657.1 DegT/DnrJ/EryC1/StrS family aminotransferase [Akkermansiaceae bacterium]